MIGKFSTVYAGHVDLPDMGQMAYVHVSNSMGTPQRVMLEQLAWFAKEVKPHFPARD